MGLFIVVIHQEDEGEKPPMSSALSKLQVSSGRSITPEGA